LRAAEKLFTERGIDRVSLREISAGAGQRNHSAAQYHFDTKRNLIEVLLERHSEPIQQQWLQRFADMDEKGGGLKELVALLVHSLVQKLDDLDGGRAYLEICAQLVTHPEMPLTTMRVAWTPGAAEFGRRLFKLVEAPPDLFPLHALRLTGALYRSIVDYARLTDVGTLKVSRELFVADLIGSLVGLVQGRYSQL
jgi:AcrR family transcriptional regulator